MNKVNNDTSPQLVFHLLIYHSLSLSLSLSLSIYLYLYLSMYVFSSSGNMPDTLFSGL
jgi:hypothetical protein